MPISQLAGRDHDGVLAPVAAENRLPKPSTMARWACFQALSVGVRCQLMPARMQWFAPGESREGLWQYSPANATFGP